MSKQKGCKCIHNGWHSRCRCFIPKKTKQKKSKPAAAAAAATVAEPAAAAVAEPAVRPRSGSVEKQVLELKSRLVAKEAAQEAAQEASSPNSIKRAFRVSGQYPSKRVTVAPAAFRSRSGTVHKLTKHYEGLKGLSDAKRRRAATIAAAAQAREKVRARKNRAETVSSRSPQPTENGGKPPWTRTNINPPEISIPARKIFEGGARRSKRKSKKKKVIRKRRGRRSRRR